MKRGTIRILITVATILLFGLVLSQVFWVKQAYEIEEKQFSYDVTQALMNTVSTIQERHQDSATIYDPVEKVQNNLFVVRMHDTIHPYYLKSVLRSEFSKLEINEEFQFSMYDCFNDTMVYCEKVTPTKVQKAQQGEMPPFQWSNDGHFFSVHFPERNKALWQKMEFWSYSSVLVLLVVTFFAYTISIILKQKRLSETKTDFINNMTHEFKTPISTIGLSSDVLQKTKPGENPERIHRYAKIIHEENSRLQSQVERILQIATIEKEKVSLKKKEFDLHEVLQHVADTYALNVEAKNGKITCDLTAKKHLVEGDKVHLENIFSNLIDNAIKYASEKPEVNITSRNEGKYIAIDISDNGVGIDKAHQKQIFDKFYRVPQGNLHDVKGFGIGLNYVKVMVEKHSGKLSLKSETGKGSTFTVKIPCLKS